MAQATFQRLIPFGIADCPSNRLGFLVFYCASRLDGRRPGAPAFQRSFTRELSHTPLTSSACHNFLPLPTRAHRVLFHRYVTHSSSFFSLDNQVLSRVPVSYTPFPLLRRACTLLSLFFSSPRVPNGLPSPHPQRLVSLKEGIIPSQGETISSQIFYPLRPSDRRASASFDRSSFLPLPPQRCSTYTIPRSHSRLTRTSGEPREESE